MFNKISRAQNQLEESIKSNGLRYIEYIKKRLSMLAIGDGVNDLIRQQLKNKKRPD